jgi:hypothetical protein
VGAPNLNLFKVMDWLRFSKQQQVAAAELTKLQAMPRVQKPLWAIL